MKTFILILFLAASACAQTPVAKGPLHEPAPAAKSSYPSVPLTEAESLRLQLTKTAMAVLIEKFTGQKIQICMSHGIRPEVCELSNDFTTARDITPLAPSKAVPPKKQSPPTKQ